MTNVMSSRRQRVMAELGLVRYALRPVIAERAGGRLPATSAGAEVGADAGPSLRVHAEGADTAPSAGPTAAIWAKVVEWLGRSVDDIGWQPDHPDAIELPPVASWTTPDGKRGLWLALKSHVRLREG